MGTQNRSILQPPHSAGITRLTQSLLNLVTENDISSEHLLKFYHCQSLQTRMEE